MEDYTRLLAGLPPMLGWAPSHPGGGERVGVLPVPGPWNTRKALAMGEAKITPGRRQGAARASPII